MNFDEEDESDEEPIPAAKRSKNEADQAQQQQQQQPTPPTIAVNNPSRRHTAPGSIDFCPMCTGKFTVTKYT